MGDMTTGTPPPTAPAQAHAPHGRHDHQPHAAADRTRPTTQRPTWGPDHQVSRFNAQRDPLGRRVRHAAGPRQQAPRRRPPQPAQPERILPRRPRDRRPRHRNRPDSPTATSCVGHDRQNELRRRSAHPAGQPERITPSGPRPPIATSTPTATDRTARAHHAEWPRPPIATSTPTATDRTARAHHSTWPCRQQRRVSDHRPRRATRNAVAHLQPS